MMKTIACYLSIVIISLMLISQGYAQNLSALSPGAKIEGPWLWVIVPTGVNGSVAAVSGIDFLNLRTGGVSTEEKVAAEGAVLGESVENKIWSLGKLPPEGGDNINAMLKSIGMVDGDINFSVAYGSIILDSPREQRVVMFVGSDDAVKVWVNGEIAHENFVDRPAWDYQDVFRVSLKAGENVLLVAVYEGDGGWSGFFGFEDGTVYKISLPRGLSVDVNQDGDINTKDIITVLLSITAKDVISKNPRVDVNKNEVVNIADLKIVIDYLDDPVTGAALPLQNVVNRPKGKFVTTWARLKAIK